MNPFVKIGGFGAWYGKNRALQSVKLEIPKNGIYAFIGPSGCGKTTLLRSINRLNDFVPGFRAEGQIEVDGEDVYARSDRAYVETLRREIGMVFQQTNPLPMTILENMMLPVREHHRYAPSRLRELAAEKLRQVSLLEEVKDRLHKSALLLSGGQQQRLCIARALMLEPKLLLMDEPCSALDPISTFKIEELLLELKKTYTVIIVTHNMEQACRIADYTAFFYQGRVIEANPTIDLFSAPKDELTYKYVTGRF